MQTAQRRITETHSVSREAGARYLILLAAGISFALSVGLIVTLIVGAALGLLVYDAILDGRYAAEHNADETPQQPPRMVAGHRPAA